MEEQYKNWFGRLHHLHYIYIILILVMIIVAFISYYHCDQKNLVAQVGFAGSISSIILSVLAIIVTVVSNGSMDKLAHGMYGLKDVPANVKKSTDEAIKKIADTTDTLNKASEESKQGIADMQGKFENLFHELERHVADKLQENAANVENIKKMVSDMQANTQSLALSMNSSESKEQIETGFSENVTNNFFNRLSLVGYILLYTIDKYLEKAITKPFDLTKFDEFYNDKSYSQYLYGCLIILISTKIINYNQPDKSKLDFTFISFDSQIRKSFKEYIVKKSLDPKILDKIDSYLNELKTQENVGDGEKK